MLSVFVTMMLMLSPMGNGHGNHFGWAKKNRNVPAYQPVAPAQPPSGGGGTPPVSYGDPSRPSGPGANQYTD